MKYLFKRKEEKFILPLEMADDIKHAALKYLETSEFNQNQKLTKIRTIYLENDDFLIYHLKKNKNRVRYKVRIREYVNSNKSSSKVWVELKEKVNGQGYKSRFKLNKKYLTDFLEGKDVLNHVINKNIGVDKDYLTILYNKIQNMIIENKLHPRLVMQYNRLALQKIGEHEVRLTFDYNLECGHLNREDDLFSVIENPQFFSDHKAIVELKIGSTFPEAVKELRKKLSIRKEKFSKFVFGMESIYDIDNLMPDGVNTAYTPMNEILKKRVVYSI